MKALYFAGGAALLSILFVVVELGALFAELRKRRGRGLARLEQGVEAIRAALGMGDGVTALSIARGLGYNSAMSDALGAIIEQRGDQHRVEQRVGDVEDDVLDFHCCWPSLWWSGLAEM